MSDLLWVNADSDISVGSATIESDDNLFTIVDHGLVDGDRVVVSNLSGGAGGVVAENGVYWVINSSADTFSISLTKAGLAINFSTDGGADVNRYQPAYDAAELRRLLGGLLFQGTDNFGGREGVLPSQTVNPVDITGTTWTVPDIRAVVYPGISNNDGPYILAHPEEAGSTTPADGSNDRIDALDLQVEDHDEDASGNRRAQVVYVIGSPGAPPSDPALTANSLRLATILVPAGGTPDPSVQRQATLTAAAGGIIVIRDDTELPSPATEGQFAYNLETLALSVQDSGVQETIGNAQGYQFGGRLVFTADDSFDKADFPGLRAIDVTCVGGGGGSGGVVGPGSGEASEAGGGGGGGAVRAFILASALTSPESITVGLGGSGGSSGANPGSGGGSSIFTVTGPDPNPTATGGGGGGGSAASASNSVNAGGSAGSASGGDIHSDGSSGGNGEIRGGETGKHNFGGSSGLGYGGIALSSAFESTGAPGKPIGGGGGGPRNNDNDSAKAGRDGADGVVIIDLYY